MKGEYSLTPEEVAEILKIKKNTVYELIKRGDLAAYRIGRKYRIEMKDVEAYKERSREQTPLTNKGFPTLQLAPAINKGNEVKAINNPGLVICGQDILLDILSYNLENNPDGIRVYRKHVGSFPGLNAVYEGKADIASAHLWDSDTDTYNIPYVRRLLPGIPTVVVHLAKRMQGFYVKEGNPLKIKQWEDLTRSDIKFVNREPGSGTRVLLDEKLRKLGLSSLDINGYYNVENSHTAVAIAVARELGDVGLGNQKAAMQVEGIEFIPMQQERYELVIKEEDLNKPVVQMLLTILSSRSFKDEVEGLGGYELSECGQLVARI
ncbi:MAG TPA: excisionase [Syntrophomonas sp.]|jgi:putative molybdopterin biosynthesis protein|nr:excisionase [Syntrophomonas sp.]HCF71371.1 excisionase [Syntrophomonas sp.]